jgi:hypothetical protein
MDRELFDAAFVSCDQAKFSSMFTDDAEFYHDRTGATYGERVKQLQSCPRDDGVKRTLVAGSLEVYPIKDFGAVQLGRHTFTREGEPGAEVAQFVHLWRYSEGEWRLARVLSFDHRPMTDQAGLSESDTQRESNVMPDYAMQRSALVADVWQHMSTIDECPQDR